MKQKKWTQKEPKIISEKPSKNARAKDLRLKFFVSSHPPNRNLTLCKKWYAFTTGKMPFKKTLFINPKKLVSLFQVGVVFRDIYKISPEIYIYSLRPNTPANVDKCITKWGSEGKIQIEDLYAQFSISLHIKTPVEIYKIHQLHPSTHKNVHCT